MSNYNKDMTVREVFEKAFGPIPEGATCHMGCDISHPAKPVVPVYMCEVMGAMYTYGHGWVPAYDVEVVPIDISDHYPENYFEVLCGLPQLMLYMAVNECP